MRPPAALALVLLAAVALPASAAAAPGDRLVRVEDYRFSPARVVVSPGKVVTWRFQDGGIPHNATGRAIRSGDRRRGDYRKRFRTRGTYRYICTFHPSMRGVVVVR